MKLAIEVSGLIRSAKQCYQSFYDNIIVPNKDGNQIDIFLTTWDVEKDIEHAKVQEKDDCSWDELCEIYKPKTATINLYDKHLRKAILKECRIEDFWNWLKKTKIVADTRKEGRWKDLTKCTNCGHKASKQFKCRVCMGPLMVHNILASHYQMYLVDKLRLEYEQENRVMYDLVVRTRFDNYFLAPIKFKQPEKNEINIAAGFDDFPEFGTTDGLIGLNDQFFWGSHWPMWKIGKVYNNIPKYIYTTIERGASPNPHSFIALALEEGKYQINRPVVKYTIHQKLDKHRKFIENLNAEEFKKVRL